MIQIWVNWIVRRMKRWLVKNGWVVWRPLLVVLVLLLLGWHVQQANVDEVEAVGCERVEVELRDAGLSLFSDAVEVVGPTEGSMRCEVLDGAGQVCGYVLAGREPDSLFYGYAGLVPVVLGVRLDGVVAGVRLLANVETPGFVQEVEEEGLLRSWDGRSLEEVPLVVDAVSGATFTSEAIIFGVEGLLSEAAVEWGAVVSARVETRAASRCNAGKCVVLLVGLMLAGIRFRWPQRCRGRVLMGYRVVMVVLFGVVLHSFLSLAVLAGCLQAAGCLARHEVVAVLAGVTLLLGAVFNRNVYCGMLCPYGQAQDLATTLCRRRPRKAPVWMRRLFPWLRAGVLCVVVLSLWTGQFFDYSLLEPFTLFHPQTAAVWTLLLGIAFLVLAMFYPRLWCVALCPTGWLLRILTRWRVKPSDERRSGTEKNQKFSSR